MKSHFKWALCLLLPVAVKAQTVLNYAYDPAGNQNQRYEGRSTKAEEETAAEAATAEEPVENLEEIISNKFRVSPNPTSGIANLQWEADMAEEILSIELTSLITSETTPVKFANSNQVSINLAGKVTGLYLVTFHLNNPDVPKVQKKIVKY